MNYETLGAEIGRLVDEKQAAYGDSFGKAGAVMRILYPSGIAPEQLDDALGVVRVLDKLFRIATDRDALGESPWRDISGYGMLGAARVERLRHEATLDAKIAEYKERRNGIPLPPETKPREPEPFVLPLTPDVQFNESTGIRPVAPPLEFIRKDALDEVAG